MMHGPQLTTKQKTSAEEKDEVNVVEPLKKKRKTTATLRTGKGHGTIGTSKGQTRNKTIGQKPSRATFSQNVCFIPIFSF